MFVLLINIPPSGLHHNHPDPYRHGQETDKENFARLRVKECSTNVFFLQGVQFVSAWGDRHGLAVLVFDYCLKPFSALTSDEISALLWPGNIWPWQLKFWEGSDRWTRQHSQEPTLKISFQVYCEHFKQFLIIYIHQVWTRTLASYHLFY